MFKTVFVAIAVVAAILVPAPVVADQNGGADCAACTLVVALVEQQMQLKKITAKQSISDFCSYMPKPVNTVCNLGLGLLEGKVIPLIEQGETADAVCNAVGMCKQQTAVCRLFPAKHRDHAAHVRRLAEEHSQSFQNFELCSVAPFLCSNDKKKEPWYCKIIPGICEVENHLPFSDTDGDSFSTKETLRGNYWRGKDCDDLDAKVYPGRATSDAIGDENCNGILGTDSTTGKTYENQWCEGTGSMGVASLGDSATAHFRIPPDYLTASKLSQADFAHLFRNLEDEMDWPMLSWSTGHLNASEFNPDINGPVKSLYSLMLERNRCNQNDYANVGVNGARVNSLKPFLDTVNRNRTNGVKPLLTIFSMVGNDVCNGHHTFSTMTTPAEYYSRVSEAVYAADAKLPNGSHVVLVPLVDGRILFDTMHDRIHPIGSTNKDVTYADLYDYLNCLGVSPCWGWMNSNATVRNTTWTIASSLNAQLPKIVSDTQGKLQNIQVHYLGNLYDDALDQVPLAERWKLIEPVDGFHPTQFANSLIGQQLFNLVDQAGILAPANPYNEQIIAKFGRQ